MILTNLFQRSSKTHSAAAVKELQQVCYRLLSEAGTANSAAIAEQVVRAYSALNADSRLAFFNFLDSELAPDRERVLRAAKAYSEKQDAQTVLELQRVVEPPRQELLRRINRAPGGTAAIIAMRRDLLKALREHPHLRAVDSDFSHLLGSWFNPGFLNLQQVDWGSPAALLEKIIRHEAVHAVKDWTDLEAQAAARPALLRVLSSAAPGRAADLRRSRARKRDSALDRAADRRFGAGRGFARSRALRRSIRSATASRGCGASRSETF